MLRSSIIFVLIIACTSCSNDHKATGLGAIAGGLHNLFHHGSQQPVPVDREPSHHLVLANDYIRVFRVDLAPHATMPLHRHDHDYIGIPLVASDLTNTAEGQQPVKVHWEAGEAHFGAAPLKHVVTNNSDLPFRNYTIELLKHGEVQLKAGENERGVNLLEGGTIESLFIKDGVRAIDIKLNPGVSVSGPHLARPHLLIDISPDDQKVQWFNAGEGTSLKNSASQPARYLLLEF